VGRTTPVKERHSQAIINQWATRHRHLAAGYPAARAAVPLAADRPNRHREMAFYLAPGWPNGTDSSCG